MSSREFHAPITPQPERMKVHWMNAGWHIQRPFLIGTLLLTAAPYSIHAAPVFTDVTDQAGVSYIQWDRERRVITDRFTGGAAVGDYDQDGWDDLYVTPPS